MKRFITVGAVILLVSVFAACSTISVNADYNKEYDFTKLKTYVWLDNGGVPSQDARINNDLIVDRVRSAVEKNLAAKGYVKGDESSADFVVSWLGAIKKKLLVDSIDHFYSPYGYGALGRDPFMGSTMGGMRTTTTREYEMGTLIVDILDPRQHKLIWRGTGTDRLGSNNDPEVITKNIDAAIDAILGGFPPGK